MKIQYKYIVAGVAVGLVGCAVIYYNRASTAGSYTPVDNVDVAPGSDLFALPATASAEDAKAKCDATPGCAGFVVTSGNGIYGKTSTTTVPAAGMVFYKKN